MDNILSDLAALGIKEVDNVELFEEVQREEPHERKGESQPKENIIQEVDFLFDKTMTCPVCDKSFKTKQVKVGKPRFSGTDSDLRPRYVGVDTVKYDAVVCLHCGYADVMRNFNSVSGRQIRDIKEKISKGFKGITNNIGPYSYETALQRYKLALYNGVVKHSKLSERAYICLKIAWLYRGSIESMEKDRPDYDKVAREYAINELYFTKQAYEGFIKAIAKEMPPLCNMDENTFNYMMADLGRRCQEYDDAEKFVFGVMSSRTATVKLKDKAREELQMIRKDKEKLNKQNL